MKITFQNQSNKIDTISANQEHREVGKAKAGETAKRQEMEGATVTFQAGESNLNRFGNFIEEKDGKEKAKTISQLQNEASVMDVGVSQDYMTVMSHTLSEEDYHKLSEEGFDISSMDPKEVVTIVDKIKAELVRSGQEIIGYTDDIDVEQLAQAVGSEGLARSLADAFEAADVPGTKENVDAVVKAWDMAQQIEMPTDQTYQYMVDNEMEPEIWDFYLAQNSGAKYSAAGEGMPRDTAYLVDEQLQKQMNQILEQAGYELNEENQAKAAWLLEKNLPVTADNLHRLDRMKDAVLPVTEEQFAKAAASALSQGKDPIHADISKDGQNTKSVYEKADEILSYYQSADAEQIAERKQLEEIRLRMTAEINVKLLKSGFSIDTAPMEELIEKLKEAETAIANNYFPEEAAVSAVEKYENWNQTNQVMADIPTIPAQILGTVRFEEEGMVLLRFHAEGMALKQTYEAAGSSYEALMTAPRADLGDSMKKAFTNVDDLAKEVGLEPVEENQRAIRILGYNHMEVSAENVERIKEAYEQVRNLVDKMTPAATLQMIRDGVNPLEQTFDQLNAYFDNLPADFKKDSESYSKYLYGLEQNHQISDEERESYIGVFRLLHQIEKKDGAAIGAVVNEQAQLQFSNLLSAVRSGKFRHMDVRANDELGTLKELVQKGEASITEQISRAYEQDKLAQMRQSVKTDVQITQMLEKGELPKSADNLMAAAKLSRNETPYKTSKKKASELWEQLSDKASFRQAYEQTMDEMRVEAEEITMTEMTTSFDVRAMQMSHIQLSIMSNLATKEEYFLSMEMGDQEALVHLTIENGSEEKGGLNITVSYGEGAQVEARLSVKDNRIDGFLLGKTSEEVTKLKEVSDIFYNLINETSSINLEATKLPVVSSENVKMTRMSEVNSQESENTPDNGMLYRVAKLFLQAMR